MTLSPIQKEILIGSLLGDGHLETQNQGRSYRWIVVQSSKKPLYLQFLRESFQDWITTAPYTRTYKTLRGQSSTTRLVTRTSPVFTPFARLFYRDQGKKGVPENLEDLLTPLALAVWYMDDGSKKSSQSKGVFFNTHGFSLHDNIKLCEILKDKFQIDAWTRPDSGNHRIYVSGKSYQRLSALITPFFTDDMWYKWPLPRKKQASPFFKMERDD
jgi:recombination protein RecA